MFSTEEFLRSRLAGRRIASCFCTQPSLNLQQRPKRLVRCLRFAAKQAEIRKGITSGRIFHSSLFNLRR